MDALNMLDDLLRMQKAASPRHSSSATSALGNTAADCNK
jgi:hypothetical protein